MVCYCIFIWERKAKFQILASIVFFLTVIYFNKRWFSTNGSYHSRHNARVKGLSNHYKERSAQIRRTCKRYKEYKPLQKVNSGHYDGEEANETWPPLKLAVRQQLQMFQMWHSPQHSFLFCMISKSASTTWRAQLEQLARAEQEERMEEYSKLEIKTRHRLRSMLYPVPQGQSLADLAQSRDLLPFAFVRNPVSRIASAFSSLMFCPDWESPDCKWMRSMRDETLRKYRGIDPLKDEKTTPTPDEFVRYILEESANSGIENLNAHFLPQWASCPFCSVEFQFLGKLETFQEDYEKITHVLELQDVLQIIQGNKRKHESDSKFWSQVSEESKRNILELYRMDFEFFGYEFPKNLTNLS